MNQSLLCLLGRHAWQVECTEDGHRYRRCRRCGTDETGNPHGSLDGAWPIGVTPPGGPR